MRKANSKIMPRSSNHEKITGNFCEYLVLYLLSLNGFECVRADHIGIDIIARDPGTKEIMGISVKGRSRTPKTREDTIMISKDNLEKASKSCKDFKCHPYFAIAADIVDRLVVFLLPLKEFKGLSLKGKTCQWKMTEENIREYYKNPRIKKFEPWLIKN
ncbi:MAG TPA: hypothetical protein VMW82_02155 [Candidatus Paceibacterota bacterium]|nr:hypothetical protein [Candidatus Paceibacterota bacterium]